MLIRAADLVATPWRNGRGVSRTIAGETHRPGAIAWQVAIADLEGDAAFSDYAGCDRIFTPIEGAVPALAFGRGPFEPCPLLVPRAFAGDVPVRMQIAGPGRAFNLIVDRSRFQGDVAVHALAPAAPLNPAAATVALTHCLRGVLHGARIALGPGDTVLGTDTLVAGPEAATVIVVAIHAIISDTLDAD